MTSQRRNCDGMVLKHADPSAGHGARGLPLSPARRAERGTGSAALRVGARGQRAEAPLEAELTPRSICPSALRGPGDPRASAQVTLHPLASPGRCLAPGGSLLTSTGQTVPSCGSYTPRPDPKNEGEGVE